MPDNTPTAQIVLTVPPACAAAWERLDAYARYLYTQQFLTLWMVGPPPSQPMPDILRMDLQTLKRFVEILAQKYDVHDSTEDTPHA